MVTTLEKPFLQDLDEVEYAMLATLQRYLADHCPGRRKNQYIHSAKPPKTL